MIKFSIFTCEVNILCIVYKLAVFVGLFGKGSLAFFGNHSFNGVYIDDVAYLNRKDYLFLSLQDVMNYLHKPENYNWPEVQDLIYLFNRFCLRSGEMRMSDFDLSVHPFIVIEGTQASGRETLSKMLSRFYSAWQVTIPPHCLAPVHHTFMHIEKKRPDFKEAYLALANYAISNSAKFITRNRPVFVTRYYYNYLAMTLSHRVMRGKPIPDEGSFHYEWPRDLLPPTFSIFLKTNVSDDPFRAQTASTIVTTFIKVYNVLKKRDNTLEIITLEDYRSSYKKIKDILQEALGDRMTGYRSEAMNKKKVATSFQSDSPKKTVARVVDKSSRRVGSDNEHSGASTDDSDKDDESKDKSSTESDDEEKEDSRSSGSSNSDK